MGEALGYDTPEEQKVLNADRWAPEVVYDAQQKLYYMFLSTTPEAAEVTTGKGVFTGEAKEMMVVAVSDRPHTGFRLVNFKDVSSCGSENLHDYNETPGISSGNSYKEAYPQYYAKYAMLDPAQYRAASKANGGASATYQGGFETGIDPHPYVAPNGEKYLFWTNSKGVDRIFAVKMINWLKPDWSTATLITYRGYYTVADWKAAQSGQKVTRVSYEPTDGSQINEGAEVIYRDGKYYLTYSANSYGDNTYLVAQAVSDKVLGPYRKLTEAEGGILLSGQMQGNPDVTGTGHHSFVEAGNQLFMIYHRHENPAEGGARRYPALDEVKWITVKDIYGQDLQVMYANGPTNTPQPKVETHSYYRNIANEAAVSGSQDACYLTDGLISHLKNGNAEFLSYIQETTIQETTTFTFDFEKPRTVKSVMLYNSRLEQSCFTSVDKIEITCLQNGKEVTHTVTNVTLNSQYYTISGGKVSYLTPCAAVCTDLSYSGVISVKITVSVPQSQESVGISEVRILGR